MAGKPGYVEEWQASLLDRCRQICQLLATVTLLSGSFAVSTVEIIERKLTAALSPTRLKIIDESARHQGHVGARPGGETHFRVEIVAPTFEGRSRLDRHRMVSDLLAHELAGQIHALSLRTLAPSEDGG